MNRDCEIVNVFLTHNSPDDVYQAWGRIRATLEVSQTTGVQQLRAEIAALATEIESCLGRIPSDDKVFSLIAKMRQLSAI
jgi:hypothetical protein